MIDENAFGLLVSYLDVEDDEYALEREDFVARFRLFRDTVLECFRDLSIGSGARAVDLGHAVYLEIAAGDETEDLVAWLKGVRARLSGRGFESVAVLTHGSRWVAEDDRGTCCENRASEPGVLVVSAPSEPFRRALSAETATRPDDEAPEASWGAGLYLDTEAVDALGRTPKNQPTILRAGGATFFRAGR